MLQEPQITGTTAADDWAIRSENWISEIQKMQPRRRVRERRKHPLILCGQGVSMRVENGALVIRDGFTHYPQQQAAYRFFPGDLELPARIILLDGSGTLSFDVLSWLGEQSVVLARVKWNGEIAVVAGGQGYSADVDKAHWQRTTRADEAQRIAFAADLIRRKLVGSLDVLETSLPPSVAVDKACTKTSVGIGRLQREIPADIGSIFAIEGECAAAYFSAWAAVALSWIGTNNRPVPDHWRAFASRSSLLSGKIAKNRMASHPINAMLNYGYTIRQTQLQIDAVSQGYDPTLGILHNRHQGSMAYILDIIEPERPKVDAAILSFIGKRHFAAGDFVMQKDGVCRLSPQLARMVAGVVSTDDLSRTIVTGRR